MIAIIGGGSAGSYLAYLLAKKNMEVALFEEHSEIGKPVQCTGIMTASIEEFFKLKKSVVAKRLSRVEVFSKNKKTEANVDEIVVWRNLFDGQIAEMAEKAGAKIILNSRFEGIEDNKCIVKDKKTGKKSNIKFDSLVGADGPYSAVAKAAGIAHKNKYYIGMQAKVKLKTSQDSFETYFGSDYPNFFGWVVPESEDTARLGMGAIENAKEYFYKFMQKRTGKKEILCWESGLIPIYNPKQSIQKGNVYLIGDAATHVKATTGGGIIPSLKAAKILAECIAESKNYNSEFKKTSGRELLLHLYMRKILNKFKDSDYDYLLSLMEQEKIKRILKKYDRDTPMPLVANLLLREPRFFLLASKFIISR